VMRLTLFPNRKFCDVVCVFIGFSLSIYLF
jgi:hypothetical protein